MKKALITGITGQDGAYLADFLLAKDYIVHGIKRRASHLNTQRVDHLYQDPHEESRRFILHYGDLTDAANLIRIIQEVQSPTRSITHAHEPTCTLAARSHVSLVSLVVESEKAPQPPSIRKVGEDWKMWYGGF